MNPVSILVVDTAMDACSVGVFNHRTGQTHTATERMTRGHAEALVPMADGLMREAGVAYGDLGAVGCTVGPGSFTGLRAGLSAAKAWGMCLDVPVAGMLTTELFAKNFFKNNSLDDDGRLCVLLETKREDVYMQLFDSHGIPAAEPESLALSAVHERLEGGAAVLIGNALARFQTSGGGFPAGWRFLHGFDCPDPQTMIDFVKKIYTVNCVQPYKDVWPVYLRRPDVGQPLRRSEGLP